MQSVRLVMREIGTTPNSITPEELDEYIKFQLTSDGFELWKQAEMPISEKEGFLGWRILLTFVKNEEVKAAKK